MSDTLRPSLIRYDLTPSNDDFPGLTPELPNELFVQRVDSHTPEAVVESLAPHIQGVLQAGYIRSFEHTGILEAGTVAQELFDPLDPDKVTAQQERMITHIGNGSQYFVTWAGDPRKDSVEQAVGVAKISPSQQRNVANMVFGDAAPNLFLNDICTRFGRRGIGAITLSAALEFGGYAPDKKLALHAFSKLPKQNTWYTKMGLECKRTLQDTIQVGSHLLQQELWVSGRGLTIGSAQNHLNYRHPDTTTATIPEPLSREYHEEQKLKDAKRVPAHGPTSATPLPSLPPRRERHRRGRRKGSE